MNADHREKAAGFHPWQPGRQSVLLACLLSLFVVYPLAKEYLPAFRLLLDLFLGLAMAAAAYAFVSQRRLFLLLLVSLALGMALTALSIKVGSLGLRVGGAALLVFFLLVTVYALQRYLWQMRQISADGIAAALNGYLMLGLAWGLIFMCIEIVLPGSFRLPDGLALPADPLTYTNEQWSVFSYLSYVTLATLGYGDVTPVSSPARSLAVLEAILGQFYLAVVVARLVGVFASAKGRGEQ